LGLSHKQQVFAEEYLRCWNSSEAARRAGYVGRANTIGPRLLANVVITAYIEARKAELIMGTDELLTRETEQGRAAYSPYIRNDGSVDMRRLVADDKAHLVKTIKETAQGRQIEFYDAHEARVTIGKHLGLFVDKLDVRVKNVSELPDDELEAIVAAKSGG